MNNVCTYAGSGAALLATAAVSTGWASEAAAAIQVGGTLAGTALLVWAIRHAYKEVARAHQEVAETHAAMRMICLEVADKCAKCPHVQRANRLMDAATEHMIDDEKEEDA